jgi:hypothetical protein
LHSRIVINSTGGSGVTATCPGIDMIDEISAAVSAQTPEIPSASIGSSNKAS